jgi:hypothetical protein
MVADFVSMMGERVELFAVSSQEGRRISRIRESGW